MFYGDCVLQSWTFFYLATKWKEIIAFWHKMEKPFLYEPYTMKGMNLSLKIWIIGLVFFAFFLMEHLMFIGMELYVNENQLAVCNVTTVSFLRNYMRRERPHLLDVLPFTWWIFPIFQWTITCLAFCWNYVDYFIIILSLGISTRFEQLNERLRQTPNHQMDRKFWLETRLHYTNLVCLLEFVDEKISLLVLLSMSHNLFLVCTKISEAVKWDFNFLSLAIPAVFVWKLEHFLSLFFRYANRPFLINNIYFYFYLFFLIFRTLFLLYSCSSIHSSANFPLLVIRNSQYWSVNVSLTSGFICCLLIFLGKSSLVAKPTFLLSISTA